MDMSLIEDDAETIFCSTLSKAHDGKYVVNLPFKTPPVPLGNSYHAALNRLRSMEGRFKKNPELKIAYVKFLDEYLSLGHMEKIPLNEIKTEQSYYLPHHAVFNPESSTTKLRVVFDGSCKSSSGSSLNDALLIGPPIQRDLFSVCLRFRQHRYVFTADLEKMYRQIWVSKEHQDFQRILCRRSSELPVDFYRLRTVTYGTSPAPFLAVRVLKQLALDHIETHPKASKILREECYVDDILTGSCSTEELLTLKDELTELLSFASFNLRKWSSNCWTLLSSVPDTNCEFAAKDLSDDSKAVKTLGLKWFPSSDAFSFSISVPSEGIITKRKLLSDSARIFDPLGFLTPVTVTVKVLYQSLWLSVSRKNKKKEGEIRLDWDDPVPISVANRWLNIRNELQELNQLRIPRWLHVQSNRCELHGFSDASEKAYAAVIYCRTQMSNGSFQCQLLSAKSKVAPINQISVVRLELCGALLLCKLFELVIKSMNIENYETFAWTDSEIVLHWLSSQPRRWKTFVANRTSEILKYFPRSRWNYVPSNQNPADCASRGLLPVELLNSSSWWHGPQWLQQDLCSPPSWRSSEPNFNEVTVEERTTDIQLFSAEINVSLLSHLLHKYSRWLKLIRVVAYCIRFIRNKCKINNPLKRGALEVSELERAKIRCLRYIY